MSGSDQHGATTTNRQAGPIRVLLTTEATYPYTVGGPSTWCDLVINAMRDIDWQILPIVSAGVGKARYTLPSNATLLSPLHLWSEEPAPWRPSLRRRNSGELPARLALALLAWNGPPAETIEALGWCRRHPHLVRTEFRDRRGWGMFLDALRELAGVVDEDVAMTFDLDASELGLLYSILYWVARAATYPTPPTDVLHPLGPGWIAIPSLAHRSLHGTPMMITEHGMYMREIYLAAVEIQQSESARLLKTRVSRGLARACYSVADVLVPCTASMRWWEQAHGATKDQILPVLNGTPINRDVDPAPLPGNGVALSLGRLNWAKDIHTLLRVAAEVIRFVPHAKFMHVGAADHGQEAYARSCYALHEQLGLGNRFEFVGYVPDLGSVFQSADLMVVSSLTEGIPLAALEGMAVGRPIVSTAVGGVREEAIRGCGFVAPPGDVAGLAMGVTTLLRNPGLAQELGYRARQRVVRMFSVEECVERYRSLYDTLSSWQSAGLDSATRADSRSQ